MTQNTSTAESEDDDHILFTEEEWAYIGGDTDDAHSDIDKQLASKLTTVIHELDAAWHHLPDPTLKHTFSQESDQTTPAIRGALLSMMALAYHGSQISGDAVGDRVREAVQAAEAARGKHAAVDFDVRTSSMLTPNEVIERLERGADSGISFAELENLWYDPSVSPERIARCESTVLSENPEELVGEIRTLRNESRQPRPPTATVVSVEQFDAKNSDDQPTR